MCNSPTAVTESTGRRDHVTFEVAEFRKKNCATMYELGRIEWLHFSPKVTFQSLIKERWPMPGNMSEARNIIQSVAVPQL